MKLKPDDTVTYIADLMWYLRYPGAWEESDWYRPQTHASERYYFIKTQAAKSEVVLELYR